MSEPTNTVRSEFLEVARPFRVRSGETLPGVTLAYETYGELNEQKDNAILLFHALSGSQHASGFNSSVEPVQSLWNEECQVGWWDGFIGPGKALDTDHFFVICANYLGGCYGSTGPNSIEPETGKPYGGHFPHVALSDIVDSQTLLIDHLGIERLHAVVGASLGGLLCLSFATQYPHRVTHVVSIASALEIPTLQRLFSLEQIMAIENDPHFNGGHYYDGPFPRSGLALARMISHKTYISLAFSESRARGEVRAFNDHFEWYQVRKPQESYMLHQGRKFVKRFDANTYLRILEAWQRFDLLEESGYADYATLFARCVHQKYLVFSIDSDVCFYPEQQGAMVETLKKSGASCMHITVHSDKGHDAFLLEPELFEPHLNYSLNSKYSED